MDNNKKTKTILVGVGIILFVIFVYTIQFKPVEIIYFTNLKCRLVNETDNILNEIKNDLKERVYIRRIIANMYPDDPPDSEEIKQLRERYEVYGVPTIIINGKEFTEEFTKDKLKKAVCDNFLIKPMGCE